MAYLDYAGLKQYDTKLKSYIAEKHATKHIDCRIYLWEEAWGSSVMNDFLQSLEIGPFTAGYTLVLNPTEQSSIYSASDFSKGDIVVINILNSVQHDMYTIYDNAGTFLFLSEFDTSTEVDTQDVLPITRTLTYLPLAKQGRYVFVVGENGLEPIYGDDFSKSVDEGGRDIFSTVSFDQDYGQDCSYYMGTRDSFYSHSSDSDYRLSWGEVFEDYESGAAELGISLNYGNLTEIKGGDILLSNLVDSSTQIKPNSLHMNYVSSDLDITAESLEFDAGDANITTLAHHRLEFEDTNGAVMSLTTDGYGYAHLMLRNDIYNANYTSTGLNFECSSSDARFDTSGIYIGNYGGGDITPKIQLEYNDSYTYEVKIYTDNTGAIVKCSDDGVGGPYSLMSSREIYTPLLKATVVQANTFSLPSTDGGTTITNGLANRVPVTNGSTMYWSYAPVYKTTTTTNAPFYPLLSANTTTGVNTTNYVDSNFYFNPSTNKLYTTNLRVTGYTDLLPPSGVFTTSGTYQNSIYLSQYYSGSSAGSGTLTTRYWTGGNSGTSVSGNPSYNFYNTIAGLYRVTFGATGANTLFSGSKSITGFILGMDDVIEMPNYYAIDTEVYDNDTKQYVAITTYRSLGVGVSRSSAGDGTCYLTCSGTVYMNSNNGWRPTVHLEKLANYQLS